MQITILQIIIKPVNLRCFYFIVDSMQQEGSQGFVQLVSVSAAGRQAAARHRTSRWQGVLPGCRDHEAPVGCPLASSAQCLLCVCILGSDRAFVNHFSSTAERPAGWMGRWSRRSSGRKRRRKMCSPLCRRSGGRQTSDRATEMKKIRRKKSWASHVKRGTTSTSGGSRETERKRRRTKSTRRQTRLAF